MQELTTGMREKGINNMAWIDREEWRRMEKKNITLGTERCANIDTLLQTFVYLVLSSLLFTNTLFFLKTL